MQLKEKNKIRRGKTEEGKERLTEEEEKHEKD